MTGFFSIVQVSADNKFEWRLYSNNHRLILKSQRTYNQASHARDAARRLHKIVANASFQYGIGFKKPRKRRLGMVR